MAVAWSIAVAAIYYATRRYTRGAWVISLAVLSHWILDFIVHRPDLPLWPSGPRVGLGLWYSWSASIAAEVLIFAAGVWTYGTATRARDVIGRYAFWALVAFLLVGYVSVLAAGAPPNVTALARGGLMMWLLVLWGWWADKHRDPVA